MSVNITRKNGWHGDSNRHSLAASGSRTRKTMNIFDNPPTKYKVIPPSRQKRLISKSENLDDAIETYNRVIFEKVLSRFKSDLSKSDYNVFLDALLEIYTGVAILKIKKSKLYKSNDLVGLFVKTSHKDLYAVDESNSIEDESHLIIPMDYLPKFAEVFLDYLEDYSYKMLNDPNNVINTMKYILDNHYGIYFYATPEYMTDEYKRELIPEILKRKLMKQPEPLIREVITYVLSENDIEHDGNADLSDLYDIVSKNGLWDDVITHYRSYLHENDDEIISDYAVIDIHFLQDFYISKKFKLVSSIPVEPEKTIGENRLLEILKENEDKTGIHVKSSKFIPVFGYSYSIGVIDDNGNGYLILHSSKDNKILIYKFQRGTHYLRYDKIANTFEMNFGLEEKSAILEDFKNMKLSDIVYKLNYLLSTVMSRSRKRSPDKIKNINEYAISISDPTPDMLNYIFR